MYAFCITRNSVMPIMIKNPSDGKVWWRPETLDNIKVPSCLWDAASQQLDMLTWWATSWRGWWLRRGHGWSFLLVYIFTKSSTNTPCKMGSRIDLCAPIRYKSLNGNSPLCYRWSWKFCFSSTGWSSTEGMSQISHRSRNLRCEIPLLEESIPSLVEIFAMLR